MTGYTVGQPHPSADRRQFHQLSDAEVADLAEGIVYSLVVGLRVRGVAGAERAAEWPLGEELRQTITRHHEQAFRRWLAERLERR